MRSVSMIVGAALVVAGGGCGKKDEAVATPGSAVATASTPAPEGSVASKHTEAASATASATAHKSPPPPAPKKLTAVEAEQLMTFAATEYKKPSHDCHKVATSWSAAIDVIPSVTPSDIDATYGAARCFQAAKQYDWLKVAGYVLAKMDPTTEKYAFVPNALIGLKDDADAAKMIVEMAKKHPDAPDVLFAGTQLLFKYHKYPELLKAADETAKAADASKDPDTKSISWRARVLRHVADLNLGKLADAEKDIDAVQKAGAPQATVDELRREIVPMKQTKIGVDFTIPTHLYLGTYHLHGHAEGIGDFVDVSFVNFTGKDQALKVEVEIPGITDHVTKTETLLTGKSGFLALTPTLKTDFKPSTLSSERTSTVNVKVSNADGKVIFEDSRNVTVFPRDQFPKIDISTNTIAAWVTPQAGAIEEFMTAAKKRAGGNLEGNLGPTVPQVKALYDELHERGMSYVLVSDFGYGAPQHVRLPAESIKSTNALCLDGAVLFATLMEKIGLKPVVVFVPRHAFVGWHAEAADKAAPGTMYWVETTMVGTQPYEVAFKFANDEYKKYADAKTATLVDIQQLRAKGYTAQPYE